MDESLTDALLDAGERLAEALRLGLQEAGLPHDLHIVLDGRRVMVASRSPEVREAEFGSAGLPPRALMEGLARQAAPDVIGHLSDRLKGALR